VAAFARTRRAARRDAHLARERLGAPLASLAKLDDGMRVTLGGRLEAGGDLCARFEDGAPSAAASAAYLPSPRARVWAAGLDVRAARLAILVGEARVELEGPVQIVAGSREVHKGRALARMPRAVQARVEAGFAHGAPPFRDRVIAFRSLAAGDRVRVSGVLRREAGAAEGGSYRAAAARWSLVPDGDAAQAADGAGDAPGLQIAFEGAPRVLGPAPATYGIHLAGGAALFVALFGLGGEIAYGALALTIRDLQPAAELPLDAADRSLTAVSIIAATPFRSASAMEAIGDALDVRDDSEPAWIERRVALHTVRGDCEAAANAVIHHEQLERGAEMAERCGQHESAAHASYAAGDFARASASWERADSRKGGEVDMRFGVRVHLLAGRVALAAAEARRLADKVASYQNDIDPVERARCLADALDARAGDEGARARLLERHKGSSHLWCALLVADLHQGAERTRLIHGFQPGKHVVPVDWLELLATEADPGAARLSLTLPLAEPSLLVANPRAALSPSLPAVERAAAEALAAGDAGPRRRTRSRVAAMAAVFAAIAGDGEQARRFADVARASVESAMDPEEREGGTWIPAHVQALSAAIELELGDVRRARELVGPTDTFCRTCGPLVALIEHRERGHNPFLAEHLGSFRLVGEGARDAFLRGMTSDGSVLKSLLSQPGSDVSLLRSGASLGTHQDELLRWLRHGRRLPGWFHPPTDQLLYWMNLAAAASAAGDEALAGMLRGRAARFREGLLRRELAVPLAVLDRL
jgi:hypothetical protein